MKKFVKAFIFTFLLINLALTVQMYVAHAAGEVPEGCAINPNSPLCILQKVGKDTDLPDFYKNYKHPDAPDDFDYPGITTLASPILYAIDLFRFAISGIAILVILFQALKLIGESSEEEAKKAKMNMLYGIMGLLFVQFASTVVRSMFFGDFGQAFQTTEDGETVTQVFAFNTATEIRGIVGFIDIFVGVTAVLVIILRAFTLMTGAGEEEANTKAKKHIGYAVAGLLLVGLAEMITRGFAFPAEGQILPDLEYGKLIVYRMTNFVSGFIAIGAFLMLFYAGYRYVMAGATEGEIDKVKKIILGAVIGLVISLGAYAAVHTLITLEVPEVIENNTPTL